MRGPGRANLLGRTFIAASTAWAAVLPLSVYAGTRHPTTMIALMVAAVYAAGSVVCHQLPERSFHLWGAQLPVCARCTGIYVGAAIMSLFWLVASRASNVASGFSGTFRDKRSSLVRLEADTTYGARAVLISAALPTFATLAYEWTTGVTPSNAIRALAGFSLGAAIAAIVLSAADNQVN